MIRLHLSSVLLTGALLSTLSPASAQKEAKEHPPLSLPEFARAVLDAQMPPSPDKEAQLATLDRALRSYPSSPYSERILQVWRRIAEAPDAPAKAGKRLQELLQAKLRSPLHGNARLVIESFLTENLRNQGKYEEAAKLDPRQQYVQHALAVGPFGDSGRSFRGVAFEPELQELSLKSVFRGRFGGKLRWRCISLPPYSSSLELKPRSPAERSEGAQYALIQVKSPGSQVAWTELSCYGPYELWWNGQRIANVDRIKNRPPVRSYFATPMHEGWNRLLVKTVASSSRVGIRFVDSIATPLPGLHIESERKLHPIGTGPAPLAESYEDELAWLARKSPGKSSATVLALRAHSYMRHAQPDLALAMSRKAIAAAPKDISVAAAHFEILRQARRLPRDLQRSEERAFLDRCSKLSQEHWHLTWRRMARLAADDKSEEALQRCDELLAKHPGNYQALRQKARLLENLDWDGMAAAVLDEIFARYPTHPKLILEQARRLDRLDDTAGALSLVEKARAAGLPGHRALLRAAYRYSRDTGALQKALALRSLLDRDSENSRESLDAKAELARKLGDHEQALALFREIAKKEPQNASAHEDIADSLLTLGRLEEAVQQWKTALAIDPSKHGLRERIAYHERRPYLAETERYRLDALAEVARYKSRPEDQGAPSTLVLDQMVIRVFPDGSQMEETQQLRRLNDKKGVQKYENAGQAADADELIELRSIDAKGKVYRPQRVGGSFSMPRLAPGMFIEEHYRNYKSAPGLKPIDFTSFFFANADEPFRYSRLVVILPKEHKLGSFLLTNYPKADWSKESLGDLEAHIFLKRNMPRMPTEPAMPELREIAPWVTFGRRPETTPFVRSGRESFQTLTLPWLEIREKAKEILSGLNQAQATPGAKARAIHDFVHRHVKRAGNSALASPLHALLQGEGNRFGLELALLEAAGVPWTPAILDLQASSRGIEADPLWNAPFNYKHLAARIESGEGKPFWLIHGAPRYFPIDQLPPALPFGTVAGAPYLLLRGTQGEPGRLPDPGLDQVGLQFDGTLRLHGRDAALKVSLKLRGMNGYRFSEQVRIQDENTRQLIAQNVTRSFFSGWTVRGVRFPGIEKEGQPVTIELNLRRKNFARKRGNELLLPPLPMLSQMQRRFATRAERKYPFVSGSLDVVSYRLRLELGDKRCSQRPQGLLRRKLLLDYGLSWEMSDHGMTLSQKRILRPGRIPASRFPEWIELCKEVDRIENMRLRIR
ncbi:MAG: hypothetical protein CSA62_02135 [Planctomycetota bacterium]|nr:MAG: hypothetical protein CSA62_02135 [Planctomycetota bacterium]